MAEPRRLPAKFHLGRLSGVGADHGRSFRLTLTDPLSGSRFVEVDLTLEAFAEAIHGSGEVECEVELAGLDVIGKRRQHTTVWVAGLGYATWNTKEELVDAATADLQADGWVVDSYGLSGTINPHRLARSKGAISSYEVHLYRYVEVERG